MKTLILMVACASALNNPPLQVKGSDTMVHLVTAWAEAYMNANPDDAIAVTGGGSGTGIAAVLNGTTELCMSSREVAPKELELARSKNIDFRPHTVARDGLAIVVHPTRKLGAIDLDQLRQVYNGTIQNWKALGSADEAIQVLSRESSSGTYGYFKEAVLKKDEYAREVRLMPSTAAIVQSVGQDSPAIGYVGLGYLKDAPVKVVPVKKDAGAPAITPTPESVVKGTYPLARPLYFYTKGEPQGLAKKFIDFALSAAGQKIVVESGYVTVK